MDQRINNFVNGLIQLSNDTGFYIQPNLGGTMFITDTRNIPTKDVVIIKNDYENSNTISYTAHITSINEVP